MRMTFAALSERAAAESRKCCAMATCRTRTRVPFLPEEGPQYKPNFAGGACYIRPHRRVRHLRPPAGLGLSAQDRLPRSRGVCARRGWRRLLRDPRQHDGGHVVLAALLAPPAPRHLAGEAATVSRLLRVRAQRPAPRQSPAWRPRRGSGGVIRDPVDQRDGDQGAERRPIHPAEPISRIWYDVPPS